MKRILLLVLLGISCLFAQDNILNLRDAIGKINMGFLNSKLPGENDVISLEQSLSLIETGTNNKFNFAGIKTELGSFFELLISNNDIDSLKKAFRLVNNKFNSVTGKYFYDKVINSSKQKIIVFSTSMSCECTLEMCNQQEVEVQKFRIENHDKFDFVVIDTWIDSEFQQKYKVDFVPSVIILNKNGEETNRAVRIENISVFLNTNLKQDKDKI